MVVAVMALNLAVSFAIKAPCGAHPSYSMPSYCDNDIQYLWSARHLDLHLVPTVHGNYQSVDGLVRMTDGELEYPILTSLLAWAVGIPAYSHGSFFVLNAALLAMFGLFAAFLLGRMAGWRAMLLAASPAVAFYGFQNWDLLAAALAVAGVYLWWRRHPYAAAAAFALGGCAKLWPAVLLVPLALDAWTRRERSQAVMVATFGVLTGVAVNLPFMVINYRGWYAPFAFQSVRAVDVTTNSFWYYTATAMSVKAITDASWLVTIAAFAAIAVVCVRRAHRDGFFPMAQCSLAMVIAFTLLGKTFSPQYTIWIVPFFVLVKVRTRLWVAVAAGDAGLWVLWFGHPTQGWPLAVVVWLRAAALTFAAIEALRGASTLDPTGGGTGLAEVTVDLDGSGRHQFEDT